MRILRGLWVLMLALPLTLACDTVPPPAAPASTPLVVVYGDSYVAGDPNDPNVLQRRWPGMLAADLGVNVISHGVGQTGYVRATGGSTYPYAVATQPPPSDADVVIVFGGFNDAVLNDPTAVGYASTVTYTLIRQAAPDAELIVIGMQWPNYYPGMNAARPTATAIRTAADQAEATFVDPFLWLQTKPQLMAADAIHPSDQGHAYLEGLIEPYVLQALSA